MDASIELVKYADLGLTLGLMAATMFVNWVMSDFQNDENHNRASEMNERNIQAQKEMNALNRQQALSDYEMVNKYNHPKQQMQRLKEAGLNPNLVYGNGTQTMSAPVRSTENKAPLQSLPEYKPRFFEDPTSSIAQMYNMGRTNVQTENEKTKGVLLQQQEQANKLKMTGQAIANDKNAFNLGVQKDLRDITVEKQKLDNDAQKEKIALMQMAQKLEPLKFGLDKEELRLKTAKNSAEIQSINADIMRKTWENTELNPQRLANLKGMLSNMERTGKLMELETLLREKGIQPSDPLWTRIMVRMSDALRPGFEGLDKRFEQMITGE